MSIEKIMRRLSFHLNLEGLLTTYVSSSIPVIEIGEAPLMKEMIKEAFPDPHILREKTDTYVFRPVEGVRNLEVVLLGICDRWEVALHDQELAVPRFASARFSSYGPPRHRPWENVRSNVQSRRKQK